jgi:hypothetical protein
MSKGGTTTSTSSIDPQIKEAFLANFQQAQGVAGALPTQQFAGYNPMYMAGEEALVNTCLSACGNHSAADQFRSWPRCRHYWFLHESIHKHGA